MWTQVYTLNNASGLVLALLGALHSGIVLLLIDWAPRSIALTPKLAVPAPDLNAITSPDLGHNTVCWL